MFGVVMVYELSDVVLQPQSGSIRAGFAPSMHGVSLSSKEQLAALAIRLPRTILKMTAKVSSWQFVTGHPSYVPKAEK